MKSWKKLTALLLAGVLAGSAFTGCGKQSNDSSKPESSAAEESSVKETEAAAETTEATTTTVHVSPTETVSSTLGTELTDINAMLDKGSDTANNYKAKLDNFIQEGDVVCRVSPNYATAMHIDTDESNAIGAGRNQMGEIVTVD